ncbi:MAG: hypothetical protein A3E07_01260 [Candidatus Wildermuthbacteria bacterium RIFCSPHIGHO2_12_FULL_45_9]|uniref:NAD-dependent epimerase/dehydratase domain-containing protein n=1 Tax=Candidatus Wildermuthbacteria bacterium RIFCSPHIGHO2_02_FULL_45_25 TaxID=1802450 RepID=A0A1G2R0Z1_9BACT|nr:MAG: hypothetical protein A2748_02300 [Candidatus Wildermuthbacteria bacterium RIFCSPHIGHO2_01_FULL_45_20]OHA65751.1 MAG: hypothetical protein A3C04_02440 [Candidatus Wildermuthbacteria bacterium RIFCSPHIGHO2_02_FULL_45_25]OHA70905.1 MAG: hypothetical protein A3E07_01260 [Candidatus Wildermuthbacteria bacterium RIFCSPHIGHO2_12_FULL_45_9]
MKIGITGATGFVGSHLVRHLSSQGHNIVAYGRSKPAENLLKFADFRLWDITRPILERCEADIFIHCAGFVDTWGRYRDMYDLNVMGTKRALEFAEGAEHFIYMSTASVYNPWYGKHLATEDSLYPEKYANNYGATKAQAERMVKDFSNKYRKVTILRPHVIYGPGDRHIVPRILKFAERGKEFVIGDGTNEFSITHVGNICYAVSLLLAAKLEMFRIFNVTDDKTLTVNELLKRLCLAFDLHPRVYNVPYLAAYGIAVLFETQNRIFSHKKTPLFTRDIVRQFSQESTLSIEKIKRDLHYDPPYDFNNGIQDIKLWVDSIGGRKEYISNPNEKVWQGKLFTY